MTITLFLRFFDGLGLKQQVNFNININKINKLTRESSWRSTAHLPTCTMYIEI